VGLWWRREEGRRRGGEEKRRKRRKSRTKAVEGVEAGGTPAPLGCVEDRGDTCPISVE